jgi:hypothetical protein
MDLINKTRAFINVVRNDNETIQRAKKNKVNVRRTNESLNSRLVNKQVMNKLEDTY